MSMKTSKHYFPLQMRRAAPRALMEIICWPLSASTQCSSQPACLCSGRSTLGTGLRTTTITALWVECRTVCWAGTWGSRHWRSWSISALVPSCVCGVNWTARLRWWWRCRSSLRLPVMAASQHWLWLTVGTNNICTVSIRFQLQFAKSIVEAIYTCMIISSVWDYCI